MERNNEKTELLCEYYAKWISVYKVGAIRDVTLNKYKMTQKWLTKLVPNLKLSELNRISYQQLLNDYAATHERQTTMDFHHQLKGAILDAVDEGLIERDPTRKAIIKGKTPSENKKIKSLIQFELHTLISTLNLSSDISWDWFILLVAKTGLRHTHASILLFAGVSIASVARRLGHSSMNTTQKTYLHIIQELENRDIDLVMRSLSVLN